MKFKIGDIVWCKWPGIYGITNYHVKCKVFDEGEEEWGTKLEVEVLEGIYAGNYYPVDAMDFELVSRKAVIV